MTSNKRQRTCKRALEPRTIAAAAARGGVGRLSRMLIGELAALDNPDAVKGTEIDPAHLRLLWTDGGNDGTGD